MNFYWDRSQLSSQLELPLLSVLAAASETPPATPDSQLPQGSGASTEPAARAQIIQKCRENGSCMIYLVRIYNNYTVQCKN